MKIVRDYKVLESKPYSGDGVRGVTGRIAVGKDDGAPNFCMRVFTVNPGGFTPKHSHDWEHEVFIHSGSGQVLKGNEWQDVAAGSAVFVPGGEEHQFRNNTDQDLVFVCLIPKGAPEL